MFSQDCFRRISSILLEDIRDRGEKYFSPGNICSKRLLYGREEW